MADVKTHGFLLSIFLLFCIPVVTAILLTLTFASSFVDQNALIGVYVGFGALSLALGFICALLVRKMVGTELMYFFSACSISGVSAGLVSFVISSLHLLKDQLPAISIAVGAPALVELWGPLPHSLLTGTLILVFINIPFLFFWARSENNDWLQLFMYLFMILLYLIIGVAGPTIVDFIAIHGSLW